MAQLFNICIVRAHGKLKRCSIGDQLEVSYLYKPDTAKEARVQPLSRVGSIYLGCPHQSPPTKPFSFNAAKTSGTSRVLSTRVPSLPSFHVAADDPESVSLFVHLRWPRKEATTERHEATVGGASDAAGG
jgi:hypothetical protein